MTRRWFFSVAVALVWAVALVLVAKSALDRLPVATWGNPIGGDDSLPVDTGAPVGQRFIAPMPGLYRIDLQLDRDPAAPDQTLTFHLKRDPASPTDLWATTFSSAQVQDGVAYSFEFPVQRDSMGQSYYLSLESSAPATVAARFSSTSSLEGASAYLDGQPAAGNLQFSTYYSLRTRERLDLLLARLARGKPYFLGSKGFYVGLGLAATVVLGAFLAGVARSILSEGKEGP